MADVDGYLPGVPSWVDLVTTDPEDARRFYGTLLGWEFDIGPDETGNYTMCLVRGRRVAGMNGQPSSEYPPGWTTYLATDDADAAAARITDAGGTLVMGPLDVPGQGRLVVAVDPVGAIFGLWEAGAHRGAEVVNEPGAMSWNELETRDLDGAQRFYGAVCGYDWEDVDTGGDGPRYRTFHVDGRAVGGLLELGPDFPADIPPHWQVYFAVPDVDAAVTTVEQAGGQVLRPATDSGFGRFAVVADPQGATSIVITPPPAGGW